MIVIARDGVLNDCELGSVNHRTQLCLRDDRVAQLVELHRAGHEIVLIASQPGLSVGTLGLDELDAIHSQVHQAVEAAGGQIAGLFYCPHEANDQCNCKPPATGLFEVIAIEYDIALDQIICFSANESEQTAAAQAGCRVIATNQNPSTSLIDLL